MRAKVQGFHSPDAELYDETGSDYGYLPIEIEVGSDDATPGADIFYVSPVTLDGVIELLDRCPIFLGKHLQFVREIRFKPIMDHLTRVHRGDRRRHLGTGPCQGRHLRPVRVRGR